MKSTSYKLGLPKTGETPPSPTEPISMELCNREPMNPNGKKNMAKKAQESMTYMCIPLGGISPIDGGDQGARHELRAPKVKGGGLDEAVLPVIDHRPSLRCRPPDFIPTTPLLPIT